MTDPLRDQKVPLGETKDDSLSSDQTKAIRSETQQNNQRSESDVGSNGHTVETSDQAAVSSGDKKQKRKKRWRHKNRRWGRPVQQTNPATAEHSEENGVPTASKAGTPQQLKDDNGRVDKPGNNSPSQSVKNSNNGAQTRNSHRYDKIVTNEKPLYAALDLGTNNCRLLIARPTRQGQFHVVDAFSRIVRLGEGLDASGKLSDEAMDRAVSALKVCASKLTKHDIKNYRLIATEACRSAANGDAFLLRVKAECGLKLEIINRQTEARLAVSGCASLVERQTQSLVLFDIGGGSSEIAIIDFVNKRTPKLANHITSWTSLPVGVVTMSERHGGQLVTPEIFEQMVVEVEALLTKHAPEKMLAFTPDLANFHLLGTSGTVTTLAGLHLNLQRYDRRKVDGLWLESADVDQILSKLISWDLKTRSENPCIGVDRADLVLAGCAIMEAIRRRWPAKRLRVADRGLREGLLNDMMTNDGVWRRRKRFYKNSRQHKDASHQPEQRSVSDE